MKRLFVDPQTLRQRPPKLSAADHHHITRVMRLSDGDVLELADGSGALFRARIAKVEAKATELELLEELQAPPAPPPKTALLFGLARGARTDFVLQKATELAVDELHPVICEHSVARPTEPEKKQRRWQEIVRQASRQSERVFAPQVLPPRPLDQAIASVASYDAKLVADGDGEESRAVLHWEQPPRAIALLVGPEGGLSSGELSQCQEHGFKPLSLGPFILRTETAATALLAMVNHATGRFASGA